MKKRKHLSSRTIHTIVLSIAFTIVGLKRIYIYLDNYYEASSNAWSYINYPADSVDVVYKDNTIVYTPENTKTAFIFYPGGLVESEAYAPLLEQLAENGIMCIEVQMPFYLALLDANGASGIQAQYPEIDNWYIGGHSLGGAMASLYVGRHVSEYEGLVLLASYPATDLRDSDLDVLSIRGTNDGVLNMVHYDENLPKLPSDYEEVIIDGGCHAYFGDYGQQVGDGQPEISVVEQIDKTVEAITKFVW